MSQPLSPAAPALESPSLQVRRGGYWAEVWRRYRKSRLGLLALLVVALLGFIGAAAPLLAGTRPIVCRYKGDWYFPCLYYYNRRWENGVFFRDGFRISHYPRGLKEKDPQSLAVWPLFYADPQRRVEDGEWGGRPGDPYAGPPSPRNPFGTDGLGQDVLARMVHGTSIALLVGFVAMGIAAVIGLLVGGLAGYFGGWVDVVLSRLIELVMSVPSIILILGLIAILERPTIWHTMAVIGCTRWESIARYARAEFMRLKETDFVQAARALGVPAPRIMFRHMLPNALAPVVVALTFGIAGAILLESGLSFLGLGTELNGPSWGRILNDGFQSGLTHWWLVFFPGLAIFVAVLVYNLVGDAFQEASDPRLRS
jgi:peptide/nickel transport system permease protein